MVRDSSGNKYLLLINQDDLEIGSAILQPGTLDNGTLNDKVAVVTKLGSDGRYKSGALARLLPGIDVTNDIPGFGRILGVASAAPDLNQIVTLSGRSSGITKGRIDSVATDLTIGTDNGVVKVVDTITVKGLSGSFSQPGDAGAPVLTLDGRLIGVVIAGSSTHTIVLSIQRVLRGLGVELIP
jgi:hypothetical protein